MDTYQQLQEAAAYLQPYITNSPKVGIVLGSGLGNFVQEIKVDKEMIYAVMLLQALRI